MSRAVAMVWAVLAAALAGCASPGHRGPAPAGGSPGATGKAPVDADQAAIRAVLTAYYADYSRRDWYRVVVHFWPGATVTTVAPGQAGAPRGVTTVPVEEFIGQAESLAAMAILDEQLLRADVHVDGDLAQAWVTYQVRMGEAGDVATWSSLDAFTLMRADGRWRITSLAFAPP